MLISYPHQFIFIHIHKTGGTSISAALLPFTQLPWQRRLHQLARPLGIKFYDPQPHRIHIKARELVPLVGKARYSSYFKFAFVRNPWDWLVSHYNYILKDTLHYQHQLLRELGSFEAFIRWRCTEGLVLQKEYLFDESGQQLVDFVGRFEQLESDFQSVCTRVGISAQLPRLNVTATQPYRSYYDPELLKLVAETHLADFEAFGYDPQ